MSNSAGSGGIDLKAFCSTVFELNDVLGFMKVGKLYKNKNMRSQSCKDLSASVLIQQSTEVRI